MRGPSKTADLATFGNTRGQGSKIYTPYNNGMENMINKYFMSQSSPAPKKPAIKSNLKE